MIIAFYTILMVTALSSLSTTGQLCPTRKISSCPCEPNVNGFVLVHNHVKFGEAECACHRIGAEIADIDDFDLIPASLLIKQCGLEKAMDGKCRGTPAWIGSWRGQRIERNVILKNSKHESLVNDGDLCLFLHPDGKVFPVSCEARRPVLCRTPYWMVISGCHSCQFRWAKHCQRCPPAAQQHNIWGSACTNVHLRPPASTCSSSSSSSPSESPESTDEEGLYIEKINQQSKMDDQTTYHVHPFTKSLATNQSNDTGMGLTSDQACVDAGLVYVPSISRHDLDGLKLLMKNCHTSIAISKDIHSCDIYHAGKDFVDIVDRHTCDSLVDASISQICQLSSMSLKSNYQVIKRQTQGDNDCPSVHSAVCPCCPGRGMPVIAISLVPYNQAKCVCQQLGMELIIVDSFQVGEAGRRLHDCLGLKSTAWIGSFEHQSLELCPAIQEGPYISHKNKPLYEKTCLPCNQSMPVICRAPYDMALHYCYECRFKWHPECQKCKHVRQWSGFGSVDTEPWEDQEICFSPQAHCKDKVVLKNNQKHHTPIRIDDSHFVVSEKLSHKDAQRACLKHHAKLASINSKITKDLDLKKGQGMHWWMSNGDDEDKSCSTLIAGLVDDQKKSVWRNISSISRCAQIHLPAVCEQ